MEFPVIRMRKNEYPESVREIPAPPPYLYRRGSPVTRQPAVAVIGSRQPSPYGTAACEHLIRGLAPYAVTIVSGLSPGIDSTAHTAAGEADLATVAVIGSGLNDAELCPRSNTRLAKHILSTGGTLLSEFRPETPGTPYTLLARRRIIAGLADLLIVIECAARSDIRVTAELALEYGKDVGAVPHDIFSETGGGTNTIIRQGAHVIRNAHDIVRILNMDEPEETGMIPLTREEKTVYTALARPKTKGVLLEETNFPPHLLTSTVASLTMKHLVTESFGALRRRR